MKKYIHRKYITLYIHSFVISLINILTFTLVSNICKNKTGLDSQTESSDSQIWVSIKTTCRNTDQGP